MKRPPISGAAELTHDQAFAEFLRRRREALLSDNYYESDLLWMDLRDPRVDVIFAPYETYLDDVLGLKTSYGAAVLIRNETESRKLSVYQQYVPDIQEAFRLPLETARRGGATRRQWKWLTPLSEPETYGTAIMPSRATCRMIRSFIRRKAPKKFSSRTLWTLA